MTLLWLCATGITDKALKVISAIGPCCHVETRTLTHLSFLFSCEPIDIRGVTLQSFECVCVSRCICLQKKEKM